MTSPRVSVLIPCFNAEGFVGETLESVLGQSWPAIEVIVVDDGSTDASVDVVRRFVGSTVRLIEQPHRGQTAALNKCVEYATGEFVQYLDADDLIDQDKIEKQVARLVGHSGAIASAEWGRFRRDPAETVFSSEAVWRDLSPIDWLVASRAEGLGMMFPALWLIPMPIVRTVGPWAEELTLNNDAEYFTRVLLAASAVLFCAGARCRYRSGLSGSLSGRKSVAAWTSQFRVLDLCESRVRAREDSARVRRGFALSWQHLAHGCYPYHAGLSAQALARARALDSVTIRPDGGWAFRLASRVVGWRVARRLQVLSGRG
jgi:glycosyltransferase involved in cell wall biosynthesis